MGISRRTVLGFIAGNAKATEKVYGEYKNLMFFVIASYVPSKEDCDGILSESFLKAMEHRSDLKDPGKLKPFLTSIAKKTVLAGHSLIIKELQRKISSIVWYTCLITINKINFI